jgi:hypothetical protein
MTVVPLAALALSALLMTNDPPPLSRADVETRVKQDLAAKLKIEESEIEVVEAVDREWPDDNLGCPGRKGLRESVPGVVPGYELTLAHGEKRFVYHTDRRGRFVRCDKSSKPLDRIRRQP